MQCLQLDVITEYRLTESQDAVLDVDASLSVTLLPRLRTGIEIDSGD